MYFYAFKKFLVLSRNALQYVKNCIFNEKPFVYLMKGGKLGYAMHSSIVTHRGSPELLGGL